MYIQAGTSTNILNFKWYFLKILKSCSGKYIQCIVSTFTRKYELYTDFPFKNICIVIISTIDEYIYYVLFEYQAIITSVTYCATKPCSTKQWSIRRQVICFHNILLYYYILPGCNHVTIQTSHAKRMLISKHHIFPCWSQRQV